MNKQVNYWIVTDIDGTLMDHHYDLSPAIDTLKLLKELSIPVIPCTSKTAAEVRSLRRDINSTDPYIVENGGAIYGENKSTGEEWELILGKSFNQLRPLLDKIAKKIGYPLTALNDLSDHEIELLTGLKGEAIKLALDRQWSVPFLNPSKDDSQRIVDYAKEFDAIIFKGNRMSHLLSKGSHKGKAVIELKRYLGQENVKIIALGDSQNDLPLLDVADISVVVPSKDGPNEFLLEGIKSGRFILAPAPHSHGWAMAVNQLIKT